MKGRVALVLLAGVFIAKEAHAGVLGEAKKLMDEIIVQPRPLDENLSAIRYAAACDKIVQKQTEILGDFAAKAILKSVSQEVIAFCSKPLDPNTKIYPIELVEALADKGKRAKLTDTELDERLTLKESIPALGADWQDAVLRGIAAFLESRAEAELTAALLTQMKKSLCTLEGAKTQDALNFARRLLSSTCTLVDQAEDFYTHPVAWGVLRSAFEADLEALPRTAFEILAEQLDASDEGKNVHDILVSGLSLAVWSQRGKPIVETLSGLRDHFAPIAIVDSKLVAKRPAAIGAYLIGVAVHVVDPSRKTRPKVDAARYAQLFTRLLFEAVKSDGLNIEVPADESALVAKQKELQEVADRLIRVHVAFEEYEKALAALGEPLGTEIKIARIEQRLTATVRAGTGLLREVSASAKIILPILHVQPPPELDQVESKVRAGAECAGRLFAAITAAANRDFGRVFVEASAAYAAVTTRETGLGIVGIPEPIQKYGPFIAEVAAVQTAEDMQKALENAAAPVGSWRLKRKAGTWTVALSGFVGVAAGNDFYVDGGLSELNGLHVGLTAPVGLDVAVGFGAGFGLQLFLSLIDVGSLLDIRIGQRTDDVTPNAELMNDANVPTDQTATKATVDAAPAYTFAQVLSPGLFVMLGLFDWPIVIGFGAAWKPELRAVDLLNDNNEKVGEQIETNAIQVNAFVAVDVTIFPF